MVLLPIVHLSLNDFSEDFTCVDMIFTYVSNKYMFSIGLKM